MIFHNKQCLSDARLTPYLKLCKNDLCEAICVYTSLQQRAALYFTIIQEIEIAVRNELSNKIQYWLENDLQSPKISLYAYFQAPIIAYLSSEGQKQLQKTLNDVSRSYAQKLKKAKYQTKQPDHNDIISHLPFGFWVYLLEQGTPHTKYWNNIFIDLFDNRFKNNLNLFTRMKDVLRFRNNLYHQEAVWKNSNINTPEKALKNLEKKFNNFVEYLEKLSPHRFSVVNESYKLTQIKPIMFGEQQFLSEVNSLRNMLISPGMTS